MRYAKTYWRENMEGGQPEELPFTLAHADEMRVAFFDKPMLPVNIEGIQRSAALELVNKWNNASVRYRYSIKP